MVTIVRCYVRAYIRICTKYNQGVCFRCCYKIVIITVECAVLVLRSLRSCWSCSVAGIFRLAGCDAGSVVGSPRGCFCTGMLPVDICAVSVVGSMVVASVESM